MDPINIFTEPIYMMDIEECCIEKKINEHFIAVVTGYVQIDEEIESYLHHAMDKTFIIKASTEKQGEILLFQGDICDIEICAQNRVTKVSICAKSKTAKLDQLQHIRVFQGKEQNYREIINEILSFYKNIAVIQPKGKGMRAEGLSVQYEETDWQFLKRLASQLHTALVADCTNDHICFYFGVPQKNTNSEIAVNERRMRKYYDKRLGEATEYIINSRENRNLCECICINGKPNYIYQIKVYLEHQELIYEYTLRPPSGFEVPENFNTGIVGTSIIGEVSEISDTFVRVNLFSEADYKFGKSIWFPFATVYSSPDGTGWYCMPEVGDRVRLYIPEMNEKSAYVINAVHMENEHGLRKNADEKSIRTKYQKEIRLTRDKIVITNNKGISIVLDDNEGISIKSNRKINITSKNEIEIKGEQVQIDGQQGVFLMEGPNMLMVRDGIKEHGMNIEHR